MSSSSSSLVVELDRILSERIQTLEDINYRLRTSCNTLADYQKKAAVVAVADDEADGAKEGVEDESVSDSSTSKLDEILQRAKDIRLQGQSKTKSSSSKDPSAKAMSLSSYVKSTSGPKKSGGGGGSVSDMSSVVSTSSRKAPLPHNGPPPPPIPPVATPRKNTEPVYDFHSDVGAQLDYFHNHSSGSLNPLLKWCVTKELYVSQAKRLSRSLGRPAHPQSIAYKVLPQPAVGGSSSSSSSVACTQAPNSVVIRLKDSFQSLLRLYEKHLKSYLERTSIAQLSPANRNEVFVLWLKGQKLLQLYEHYCARARQKQRPRRDDQTSGRAEARARDDRCVCEVCVANRSNESDLASLVDALIASPLHTPLLPIPDNTSSSPAAASGSAARTNPHSAVKTQKGAPSGLGDADQSWFLANKLAIAAFHDVFEGNTKFLVETAAGQCELKEVVSRLKECSRAAVNNRAAQRVLSTGSADGDEQQLQSEWREGLRMYRDMHTMLVREAASSTGCVFLSR